MTAHSLDLRERLVRRYKKGDLTYKEVAELFGVGEATVSRLMRRDRERDSLQRDPPGGGFPPRIPHSKLDMLVDFVAEAPDRTLAELCADWRKRFGVELSRASMGRALKRAGLTQKNVLLRVRAAPSASRSRTAKVLRRGSGRTNRPTRVYR